MKQIASFFLREIVQDFNQRPRQLPGNKPFEVGRGRSFVG